MNNYEQSLDRYLNGESEEPTYWICKKCGKKHPSWHKECWHCKPKNKQYKKDGIIGKIKYYCDKYNINYPNFKDYKSIKRVSEKINNKHREVQFTREINKI